MSDEVNRDQFGRRIYTPEEMAREYPIGCKVVATDRHPSISMLDAAGRNLMRDGQDAMVVGYSRDGTCIGIIKYGRRSRTSYCCRCYKKAEGQVKTPAGEWVTGKEIKDEPTRASGKEDSED